jgi:predicted nucleotidyltransferase component of viral defense system
MDRDFFLRRLYPMQDAVLARMTSIDTGFYLTGGTAASRGYLQHRFSDDLDLFVNDDERFVLWSQRVIDALATGPGWQVEVMRRGARFVRINVAGGDVVLKIEMINDVPAHVGEVRVHPVLGRLDSAENILANKLTAIVDRREPKDLADIWGFC